MTDYNKEAADSSGCGTNESAREARATFLGLARTRYSVRSYSPRPVEEDKLESILEAGRIAPTAANRQPQRVYVLKSEGALGKIRAITKSTYNAPVVLLVCYDERISWKRDFADGYDSGDMDATIVCTHMMMEAEEQGIGSCWVLLFDPKAVSEAFHLPDNIRPVCLLAVGYPAENSRPAAYHNDKKALEETVTIM